MTPEDATYTLVFILGAITGSMAVISGWLISKLTTTKEENDD